MPQLTFLGGEGPTLYSLVNSAAMDPPSRRPQEKSPQGKRSGTSARQAMHTEFKFNAAIYFAVIWLLCNIIDR